MGPLSWMIAFFFFFFKTSTFNKSKTNVSAWIFDRLWRQIITRKIVKGTCRNQVFVQVQLTLVFPVTPQTDGLRQRDVRQICAVIPWSGGNSLGFFSIVKNGQNKSWIRGHVHCAPQQGVVETSEVKGHVVCKEMHTNRCTVRYCSNPRQHLCFLSKFFEESFQTLDKLFCCDLLFLIFFASTSATVIFLLSDSIVSISKQRKATLQKLTSDYRISSQRNIEILSACNLCKNKMTFVLATSSHYTLIKATTQFFLFTIKINAINDLFVPTFDILKLTKAGLYHAWHLFFRCSMMNVFVKLQVEKKHV